MSITINAREQAARADKAIRLADQFQAWIANLDTDVDPVTIAMLARRASRDAWHTIAEEAGIRTPSDLTIAVAIGFLEQRARNPRDPLADLPHASLSHPQRIMIERNR